MPNCDFYASRADHDDLLAWLFAEGTCEVYESYSRPEQPLRRLRTPEEVLALFDERYPSGEQVRSVYLQLYVLGAGPPFAARRVPLDPARCNGATFRYAAEGWGLVQLYLGAVWRGRLEHSHTNHNSQKRAEAWAPAGQEAEVAAWDFARVTAFSARLNREIRKRAASKLDSRPVLPGALALMQSGTGPH